MRNNTSEIDKLRPDDDAFESSILDILSLDDRGLIREWIRKSGSVDCTAMDIGCGTGRALSLLSCAFRHVHAVDSDPQSLRIAERNCGHVSNVSFHGVDFCDPRSGLPTVDFATVINVLFYPSREMRSRFLAAIKRRVKRGGRILLVVPSLESKLYLLSRLVRRCELLGQAGDSAEIEVLDEHEAQHAAFGVVDDCGQKIKHWTAAEIEADLADWGFTTLDCQPIEFPWHLEGIFWHRSLRRHTGWEWAVLAQRK